MNFEKYIVSLIVSVCFDIERVLYLRIYVYQNIWLSLPNSKVKATDLEFEELSEVLLFTVVFLIGSRTYQDVNTLIWCLFVSGSTLMVRKKKKDKPLRWLGVELYSLCFLLVWVSLFASLGLPIVGIVRLRFVTPPFIIVIVIVVIVVIVIVVSDESTTTHRWTDDMKENSNLYSNVGYVKGRGVVDAYVWSEGLSKVNEPEESKHSIRLTKKTSIQKKDVRESKHTQMNVEASTSQTIQTVQHWMNPSSEWRWRECLLVRRGWAIPQRTSVSRVSSPSTTTSVCRLELF